MKIQTRKVGDKRHQTLADRLQEIDDEIEAKTGVKPKAASAASTDARVAEAHRMNTRILDAALSDDRVVEAFRKGAGGVSAPICTRPLCLDYRMFVTGTDKTILAFLRQNYESFDGRVRSLEEHRIRLYFNSIFDEKSLVAFTLPSGVQRNLYKVLGHRFILQRIAAIAKANQAARQQRKIA